LPNGNSQSFLVPHWGLVVPFALTAADQFPLSPPATHPHGLYRKEALQILHFSAQLTDREKVIATYWADGPRTETPPGHWCLFAQFVSRLVRRSLNHTSPTLSFVSRRATVLATCLCERRSHQTTSRRVTGSSSRSTKATCPKLWHNSRHSWRRFQ
jgi:hypothetical protein